MVDADEVARLCYERFRSLPRRGKPEAGREWTLLAAVLKVTRDGDPSSAEMEVVSMGTGTKCIGRTAMSPSGDVLNDSHAEVIARRGCVRYLIQELHEAVSSRSSCVFSPADQEGKWKLHTGVSFIFFTSHTPCGDASIIPMTGSHSQPCPPVISVHSCERANKRRKVEDQSEEEKPKRHRLEGEETDGNQHEPPTLETNVTEHVETVSPVVEIKSADWSHNPTDDVHRTGAKCVPGGPADPQQPGVRYHSTGVLRVKPGRGEPTLSLLSCSDKLSRWGVLGFQGALLSHYLQEALYFSTVVIGKCPYSHEVMLRALVSRCLGVTDLPAGFSVRPPELLQSSLEFSFSQTQTELQHQAGQGRVSPCGASISWCKVTNQPLDVTANGYKHGVTKKALGTPAARSLLCKLELFHAFLSLVSSTKPSALPKTLRCIDVGAKNVLGLQTSLTVISAGLAAAAESGFPFMATQRQKPPPLSLKTHPTHQKY
ncbi:LOW QUALITY PROTEIN: tRNA-specific adenosine deaminase 1 [Gouania willdenowi]|uniref:LOW QUALITY PROTEIN: tRNA-specific adenosine deaminase 1 n=1 Tax=Gouania willdenowi TaxID=441366 RepID=UPI00105612B3|nr:LOW QUALITY PROTEIN: tRNA-specific adenosine deaminase 1 [Gouania willdenowi]